MLASRRWRDWNPPEKFQESAECELTKLTKRGQAGVLSVLSVPILDKSKTFDAPASIPPDDPAEWRKPFARWLDSACALSPRCFGGVTALHIAFCEWEDGRGGVPCTRDTFERLLSELGFLVGEVDGVVLVSGLILREDFEACQCGGRGQHTKGAK
jgi:hypothetical protein